MGEIPLRQKDVAVIAATMDVNTFLKVYCCIYDYNIEYGVG